MSDLATLQRREALEAANRVRSIRFQVKEHIRSFRTLEGSINAAADVLESAPAELDTMRVETLLKSVFRLGPSKAQRMMLQAGVPLSRSIGSLTRRQRETLVQLMRERDLPNAG